MDNRSAGVLPMEAKAMSLSQGAARTMVPLLSRLVLAAAFIPTGWDKFMGEEQTYTGRDAEILKELGVGRTVDMTAGGAPREGSAVLAIHQNVPTGNLLEPVRPPDRSSDPPLRGGAHPSAGNQLPADEPSPGDSTPPPEPKPSPVPVKKPVSSVRPPATPSKALSADAVMAKRMYVDAVSLVESGLGPPSIPKWIPVWLARIGSFIELIGAGLLVIGIFSRVWAFGMVVLVGISFYATCGSIVGDYGLTPLPVADFSSVFSHVGLLVLAAGVLATGAGGLSLDHLLWGDDSEFGDDQHMSGF